MNEHDDSGEKEIIQQTTNEAIQLENNLPEEFKSNLKVPIIDESSNIASTPYKVAIIGMNELGLATTFLLICRQLVTDIVIIDRDTRRLAAEYADLSACTTFVSGVNIQASSQLTSCKGARVVILCDVSDNEEEQQNGASSIFPNEKNLIQFETNIERY